MRLLALLGLISLGLAARPGEDDAAAGVGDRRNDPPVCNIAQQPVVACTGGPVDVLLDGSASFDPDGDPLDYLWSAGCGTIADPTAPVTTLTIDTSVVCDTGCGVRLRVRDGNTQVICRTFIQLESPTYRLDIKPGSCPNPINVNGGSAVAGVLPVSLVGSKTAPPGGIDTTSLLLGRAEGTSGGMAGGFGTVAPISVQIEDTSTPFLGDLCGCHELQGDGIPDLRLLFDKDQVVQALGLGQEPNFSEVKLRLFGLELGGGAFSADDCVRIVGGQ